MSFKKILPFILVLVLLVAGYFFWQGAGYEETDDAQIAAHVVPLMPKVAGYVKAVHVIDNQTVKKGDLLVEIEPRDFEIAVNMASASLNALEAKMSGSAATLKTTEATSATMMGTAQASVRAAEVNLDRATNEVRRLQKIGHEFVSKRQMDAALAEEGDARSRLQDAQAQLKTAETAPYDVNVAQSGVGEATARIQEAKAVQDQARYDLENTKIFAPENGVVSNKTVEPGAYIRPGDRLMAIVTPERWVVANFKETQLDDIATGQDADIHVDAYPKLKFKGKVDSIQRGTGVAFSIFPAQNATGNFVKVVQRVPVKITFEDDLPPDIVLGPGMSVVPKVHVK